MVKRSLAPFLSLALAGAASRPALADTTAAPSAKAAFAAAPVASATAPAAPATSTTAPVPAPSAAPAPAAKAPAQATQGELHHAPVSFATAGKPIRIRATIDHSEAVKRALLVYRVNGAVDVELEFERAPAGPYAVVIPGDRVKTPSIQYAIEIEDLDGQRRPAFASRTEMHTIQIADEPIDEQERIALARVGGRRTVLATSADYVSFGNSPVSTTDAAGNTTTTSVSDAYYRIEAGFTYRLMRIVSDFGLRGGVVRGTSPVPNEDQNASGPAAPVNYNVGLNYGSPWVRFRLHDLLHIDALLMTSLTEKGFAYGGGGGVHIGDVYGSHLQLGFESISVFGSRYFSRVDVATPSPVLVSAIIEATNTPHANQYGVRLLGEIAAELGAGFRVAIRGGYQARASASGGPSLGTTVSYAF